ncbi:MAG: glycosyltransferase family 39 protein, partial [Abditibacteriota bacterium]|nr:glycosyltransferase family 39 protein [Abditibacteriota bacterium]
MTKKEFARRRGYVILAAVVLFFAFNANIPPMGLDESMYMSVSQTMAKSGNLLCPVYNMEAFYDKPPMTYWLQAAFGSMSDIFFRGARLTDEEGAIPRDGRLFGYRAVSALAGLLVTLLVIYAGRRFYSYKAALCGGAAFAFSLLGCALSKMALTDMLLTLWCALSLLIFIFVYTGRLKKDALLVSWLFLGLALLTKGPIALGIVGLPILVFLAVRKDLRFLWDRRLAPGILIMLAVAAPWYLAMAHFDRGFLYEFFVHQNAQRALGQDFAHGYNPLMYVGVILVGMLPFSLFLAPAVKRCCRKKDPCGQFLSLWAVCVLVMFTLINSRLPGYILPMFPAAALLAGRYLEDLRPSALNRALLICNPVLSLLLGAAVGIAPHLLTFQSVWVKLVMACSGAWLAVFAVLALAKYLRRRDPVRTLSLQALGFAALLVCALPL